jgi:hypothetical protein
MHHSRLGVIVIDCKAAELSGAAAFWGGALGKQQNDSFPDGVAAWGEE